MCGAGKAQGGQGEQGTRALALLFDAFCINPCTMWDCQKGQDMSGCSKKPGISRVSS